MNVKRKTGKRLWAFLTASCLVLCTMLAQLPGRTARAAEDPASVKVKVQGESQNGKVYFKAEGQQDWKELTDVGGEIGTVSGSAISIRAVPNEGKRLDEVRGVQIRVDGAQEVTKLSDSEFLAIQSENGYSLGLTAGKEYELELGFIDNTSGGNQGDPNQPGGDPNQPSGPELRDGDLMYARFTMFDGKNNVGVDVISYYFHEYEQVWKRMDEAPIQQIETDVFSFATIENMCFQFMTFCGNLVDEGGNSPVLKLGNVPVTKDADGEYHVDDLRIHVRDENGITVTELEFSDLSFICSVRDGEDSAPFEFRRHAVFENYFLFGLESHTFEDLKNHYKDEFRKNGLSDADAEAKGQEKAEEAFRRLVSFEEEKAENRTNELKVLKALPAFYFTRIELAREGFRGVNISTEQVPSMYDFTDRPVLLENTSADKPDVTTVYYGSEMLIEPLLVIPPGDGNEKMYEITNVSVGEGVPAGAVKITKPDQNALAWKVEVLSGFYTKIPLVITLADAAHPANPVTTGYVMVERIGIDIVTAGEKSRDGKGFVPYHGAAHQGVVMEDTAQYKYSEAKNLFVTFYYADSASYKDYDMVCTLNYADGTSEVRTVAGYGEVDCQNQFGSNGLKGGDYLVWSSARPEDAAKVPVSVSVIAVKAAKDEDSFAGAMFGSGAGVTKNVSKDLGGGN